MSLSHNASETDDRLRFTTPVWTVNAAGAEIALLSAERAARENGLRLSIAVVDHGGNLLAFKRLDGASIGSADAAIRKAHTAARTGTSSKVFQDLLQGGTMSLLAFDSITPAAGGVPVIRDGFAVGAVGASGGSTEDDELVAKRGADALTAALEG